MEIVLPGCAGREAQWIDLDDYWNLHLRLDPMSGEPLSIVIYPFPILVGCTGAAALTLS